MSYDYGPLAAKAQELIARFGREITVTVRGAKDATNPLTQDPAANTSFTINAVWLAKPLRQRQPPVEFAQGVFIVADADVPAGVDLSTAATVTDDGVARPVETASPTAPGELGIIWEIGLGNPVRRG